MSEHKKIFDEVASKNLARTPYHIKERLLSRSQVNKDLPDTGYIPVRGKYIKGNIKVKTMTSQLEDPKLLE
jgi:hypothetical protein